MGTLAGVAVGGTGLSDTHGLMLTWVQVTHISTVVTIVTWDHKDERDSKLPPSPSTFFKPAFIHLFPLWETYQWLWLCSAGDKAQRGHMTSLRSYSRAEMRPRAPTNLPHFPGSLHTWITATGIAVPVITAVAVGRTRIRVTGVWQATAWLHIDAFPAARIQAANPLGRLAYPHTLGGTEQYWPSAERASRW